MREEKNAVHSSVNVLSSKVLIGDSIFKSPTSIAKGVPSFLSYFKTLSNGPAPGPTRDLPLCSQALYRLSLSCRG